MSERYKFTVDGIVRQSDQAQMLQILPSNCTRKFRNHAGRLLAEALNKEEIVKEYQARRISRTPTPTALPRNHRREG